MDLERFRKLCQDTYFRDFYRILFDVGIKEVERLLHKPGGSMKYKFNIVQDKQDGEQVEEVKVELDIDSDGTLLFSVNGWCVSHIDEDGTITHNSQKHVDDCV